MDVHYRDAHLKRAMIEHAPDDALEWSPPWTIALIDYMVETRGATIVITGDAEPELLADLDQRRAQRARPRIAVEKLLDAENKRLIQWTILGYPNEGWARTVFGEPDVERSGRPSSPPRDSTSRIRSPPGRSTSRDSGNVRRRWRNAASARSASWGRAPTYASASLLPIAG